MIHKRNSLFLLTLALSSLSLFGCSNQDSSSIDFSKNMMIYSIEMSGTYSDSTLIKYKDYEILVDGGRNSDAKNVKKAVDKFCEDQVLDLLVLTHPHGDHVGGLVSGEALSSIKSIDLMVDNGDSGIQEYNRNVVSHFDNGTNHYLISDLVQTPSLKDIKVDEDFSIHFLNNLYYDMETAASTNNRSVAFYVEYKNTILLMGGDLETNGMMSIMDLNPDFVKEENFVVFKALHHASALSNSDKFLNFVKPDVCFVSAGMQVTGEMNEPNYTIHPHMDAMMRMKKQTETVYWNGITGNLSLVLDGYKLVSAKGEGRSFEYSTYSYKRGKYTKASIEKEKNKTFFESNWFKSYEDNGLL